LYGKTILKQGNWFSFIQGIIYFSFNEYKLVPRGDSDFGSYSTGIDLAEDVVPKQFGLFQNYPNPFNPTTNIEFDLPKSGFVSLKIYNILGQEVADLINSDRMAGRYTVRFDASRYPSGMYIYRLQSASSVATKKMMLIK